MSVEDNFKISRFYSQKEIPENRSKHTQNEDVKRGKTFCRNSKRFLNERTAGRDAEKCTSPPNLSVDLCIFALETSAEKCMTVHGLCAEKCANFMKRIALQELIEWKSRADRKPLVLNGARQVGKTWLLREFARNYYKKEAYVVCRKNPLAQQLFGACEP